MNDDIVTMLSKEYDHFNNDGVGDYEVIATAITEIERLRAESDKWKCIAEDLYEWTTYILTTYMTTPAVKAYERAVRGD